MPTSRGVLAWWLALALSAGLVAALMDGAVLIATPGVGFGTVIAVMLTNLGLSLVVAAPLAPLAAVLEARPRLALLAVFVLAATVVWWATDPLARRTIDRLNHFFGRAVSVMINILDPDIVVIGGGVGNVDRIYTDGVRAVSTRIFSPTMKTRVVKPMLGDSAGVFGAAYLTAEVNSS